MSMHLTQTEVAQQSKTKITTMTDVVFSYFVVVQTSTDTNFSF